MLASITAVLGALALVLAIGAIWLAYRAWSTAARTLAALELVQHRSRVTPIHSSGPARPWRDHSPEDSPEWIQEGFRALYGMIQDLQKEMARLDAELQRVSEATTPPVGGSPMEREEAAPPVSPRGRGVDLRDGSIVPSRALAAPGLLVVREADEPALLFLNEDVEMDHLAWDRWSLYFDFGDGDPYCRYRTVEPSQVVWNASAEQGRLLSRGKAEAL